MVCSSRFLPKEDSSRSKPKKPEYPKDACRFYLNGHCKYGRKCRQKHIQPIVPPKVDDRHLKQPRDENVSWLEIRCGAVEIIVLQYS